MFQPPLSQGLLWYKVYIYSKSISHKVGTNLAQKIHFWKNTVTQNRAPNSSIRAPIFVKPEASTSSQNRASVLPIRAPILHFLQTSILHSKLQFWVTFTTTMMTQFTHMRLVISHQIISQGPTDDTLQCGIFFRHKNNYHVIRILQIGDWNNYARRPINWVANRRG